MADQRTDALRREVATLRAVIEVMTGAAIPFHDARLPGSEQALFQLRPVGLVEMRSASRGGDRVPTVVEHGDLVFTERALRYFGAKREKVWRWKQVTDLDLFDSGCLIDVSSRAALAGVKLARADAAGAGALIAWMTERAQGGDGSAHLDAVRRRLARLTEAGASASREAPSRGARPASPRSRADALTVQRAAVAVLVAVLAFLVAGALGDDAPKEISTAPTTSDTTATAASEPSPTREESAPEPSPTPSPTPSASPTPSPSPVIASVSGTYSGEVEVTEDWANETDGVEYTTVGETFPISVTISDMCDSAARSGGSCTVRVDDPEERLAVPESFPEWPSSWRDMDRTPRLAHRSLVTDECVGAGTTESEISLVLTFADSRSVDVRYEWDTTGGLGNDCEAGYHAEGTLERG